VETSHVTFRVYSFSKQLRNLVFGKALAYGVRVTVIESRTVATELIPSTKHEGNRQAVATAFYAPETKILQDGGLPRMLFCFTIFPYARTNHRTKGSECMDTACSCKKDRKSAESQNARTILYTLDASTP